MNIILSLFFVVLSAILTKIFCMLAQNTRLMDKPNDRSLHTIPIVRGGGLVFISLSLISLPFLCFFTESSFSEQYILLASTVLLASISFFDDLYTLSAKSRFLVQCIVAGLIAFISPDMLDFGLFSLENQYLIIAFLFFAIIWAINHFNFMDGLDGFCASQAIFLFVSFALLFHFNSALIYQDFCFILIFSLTGFLLYNFPPAKLFMGDIGSATLGFLSFYVALIAQQKYQIPIIYWFMLNGLFLFDATITLLRRVFNKEKWFAPHRKHAYQRLKQLGVDTRIILLGQISMNSIFLILVLLLNMNKLNIYQALMTEFVFMLIIYYLIEKNFPMFEKIK
ncbi:MraY family glycosyltransferase [Legionella tucsonensis]|uniref:Alpha-N-acetylglucosaminyltransferase n=1 Tax=Legionella tucsonensis TaxID=40335 RepID=A0A0W0ZTR8_9GAMM|nr:glycosyltransferase family 4 protein [Legionella tucsonensis]KTD72224.1 alpha-N-acetylglucosaminyltransferase [Legionella tucsonensis]